jgi:hypothetical protein
MKKFFCLFLVLLCAANCTATPVTEIPITNQADQEADNKVNFFPGKLWESAKKFCNFAYGAPENSKDLDTRKFSKAFEAQIQDPNKVSTENTVNQIVEVVNNNGEKNNNEKKQPPRTTVERVDAQTSTHPPGEKIETINKAKAGPPRENINLDIKNLTNEEPSWFKKYWLFILIGAAVPIVIVVVIAVFKAAAKARNNQDGV